MKKIFLSAMLAMCAGFVMAQDETTESASSEPQAPVEQLLVYENPKILVAPGDINYAPKDAATQVKNGVMGALMSKDGDVPIEDEGMVPAATEALTTAITKTLRLTLLEDEPTAQQLEKHPCVRYTATITGCNSTMRMRNDIIDKYILVTAYIYLTDIKTGEVVASKQITGDAWAGIFTTLEEAKRCAIRNLQINATNQINSWYPLHGHMLEKGLQKGKSQKLKEIYIDLGSKNSLGTRYDCYIYTVKRIAGRIARKYIGKGKVTEVLGDDISTVKLSKGADLIKQAFDNGAEIAISVF